MKKMEDNKRRASIDLEQHELHQRQIQRQMGKNGSNSFRQRSISHFDLSSMSNCDSEQIPLRHQILRLQDLIFEQQKKLYRTRFSPFNSMEELKKALRVCDALFSPSFFIQNQYSYIQLPYGSICKSHKWQQSEGMKRS
jgi:hypothetical protein